MSEYLDSKASDATDQGQSIFEKVINTVTNKVETIYDTVGNIIIKVPDVFSSALAPLTAIQDALTPLKMLGELSQLFKLVGSATEILGSIEKFSSLKSMISALIPSISSAIEAALRAEYSRFWPKGFKVKVQNLHL